MIYSSQDYIYTFFFSKEENRYHAKCREFPQISCFSTDACKAIAGVMDLVDSEISEMYASGVIPPQPKE